MSQVFICPIDNLEFTSCPDLESHMLRHHLFTAPEGLSSITLEDPEDSKEAASSSEDEEDGGMVAPARPSGISAEPIADLSRAIDSLTLPENPLSDIGVFTELKILKLSRHNNIGSVTELELKDQSLSQFESNEHIDLRRLLNLVKLDLSSNYIKSLAGVGQCPNLRELYMNNNLLSSVSPLKNLIRLTVLDLSHNKLQEISALSCCPSLKTLQLNNNRIYHFENMLATLKELHSLSKLTVDFNPCVVKTPNAKKILVNEIWAEELDGELISPEDRESAGKELQGENSQSAAPLRELKSDLTQSKFSVSSSELERQIGILKQENDMLNYQVNGLWELMRTIQEYRTAAGIQMPPEIQAKIQAGYSS